MKDEIYEQNPDSERAVAAYRRAAELGQDADQMHLLIIITELAATRDSAEARAQLETMLARPDLAVGNRITALRVMYNIYRYYYNDLARAESYLLAAVELPRNEGDIWEESQLIQLYLCFYIIRNHIAYLFVEMGKIGLCGKGAHNHYNPLGYELWMDGWSIVVDGGTYLYTADWVAREQFRSIHAHNTIDVRPSNQQTKATTPNLFDFKPFYSVRVIKAESNDKYIVLALERVTSAIAFPPTTHCRYIVFWKSPTIVLFFDFICGSASTTYSLGLHFSSDLIIVNDLRSNCPCLKLRNSSQEVVTLSFFSLPGTVLLKDVQVSPSYGVRLPAKKVQIDFEPIADKTCLIYAFCSSKDAEFCREIATMMSKSFLCEAPL